MKDPYLYDGVDVLRNLAGIKDTEILRKAEADITSLAMSGVYNQHYEKFDTNTLKDIHRLIFGQIYEWAGDFRTIQMTKSEEILGGDTVRYTSPKNINRELSSAMKDLAKIRKSTLSDEEIVFRLVRVTAKIWQIHPFREGNTRSVMVFSMLFAMHLDYDVDFALLRTHAFYVRNALVWASQGIYSKYEYLERIFFDAILHQPVPISKTTTPSKNDYSQIGDYKTTTYVETPHKYTEE